MSDRIGFMHAGELVQVDAPATMYHEPRNTRVADFVGKAVMLPVRERRGGMLVTDHVEVLEREVPAAPGADHGEVAIVVRPEKVVIELPDAPQRAGASLPGHVIDVSFKGGFSEVLVDVDGTEVAAHLNDARAAARLHPGALVRAGFDPADAWLCPVSA